MILVFTKRNQKIEYHSFPIFGKHGNKKQNQRNLTSVEIALKSNSKLLEKLKINLIYQDMIQYCPSLVLMQGLIILVQDSSGSSP